MPKISVIVPIYQVEDYLERCINSILKQTEQDFELILVDDGSKDRCPEICDEYASRYPQIRVIHQKNAGLSAARNAGLRIAEGEYITFVDSDDWIHKEFLSILGNYMAHCDMVCCGYNRVDTFLEDTPQNGDDIRLISSMEALRTEQCRVYVWGKLYRRSSLRGCEFAEGMKSSEDRAFNARFLAGDGSLQIGVLPEKLYYYFSHGAAITGQPGFSDIPAIRDMLRTVEETGNIALLEYVGRWLLRKRKTGFHIGDPPDFAAVEDCIRYSRKLLVCSVSPSVRGMKLLAELTCPRLYKKLAGVSAFCRSGKKSG